MFNFSVGEYPRLSEFCHTLSINCPTLSPDCVYSIQLQNFGNVYSHPSGSDLYVVQTNMHTHTHIHTNPTHPYTYTYTHTHTHTHISTPIHTHIIHSHTPIHILYIQTHAHTTHILEEPDGVKCVLSKLILQYRTCINKTFVLHAYMHSCTHVKQTKLYIHLVIVCFRPYLRQCQWAHTLPHQFSRQHNGRLAYQEYSHIVY